MADLFDLTDLAAYMQTDLDTATATQCRAMATSLVLGYCRLLEVPADPLVASLAKPIGLRVAAMLYRNPESLTAESLAGYSANYGSLFTDSDQLVLGFVASKANGYGRALSVQLGY